MHFIQSAVIGRKLFVQGHNGTIPANLFVMQYHFMSRLSPKFTKLSVTNLYIAVNLNFHSLQFVPVLIHVTNRIYSAVRIGGQKMISAGKSRK